MFNIAFLNSSRLELCVNTSLVLKDVTQLSDVVCVSIIKDVLPVCQW